MKLGGLLGKKSFDFSPEIHALAKKEELGEFRKIYSLFKPNTTPFGIGFMCLFISVFLLLLTIPLVPLWTILYLPTGTASGIILLITGLYLMLSRRIYGRWYVSLWQYGFIYEKKQTIQVFRWDQIECVQRAFSPPSLGSEPFYLVRRQDGDEIKLGNAFLGIAELIDTVLEESARHLAPQELIIPAPRSTSTFTAFKLDKQGIGNAQETLSWEEIQEFVTKDGAVTLCKKTEQP